MTPRSLAAIGAAWLALLAAPAFAQTPMEDDHMAKDHMDKPMAAAPPMSRADAKAMKACEKLSHDAMTRDPRCQRLAKAHPQPTAHDAMAGSRDDAMMAKH